MSVMFSSGYMIPVFVIQTVAGLLLLAGVYVPLALALLAPVLVNILTFHITMDPADIGPGILATVLWIVVFIPLRANFAGIFQAKSTESA